jgi:hypothetical protein
MRAMVQLSTTASSRCNIGDTALGQIGQVLPFGAAGNTSTRPLALKGLM